jgi:hypothetical protein
MIVLAAPVSISTSAISIETPACVSVAVANAKSCRSVSCTQTSDTQPEPLLEVELGLARVNEAELAMRLLAPKLRAALHRRSTIHERVDHLDAIEHAMVVLAMSFKRLDHEPLIGMLRADLAPSHATTLIGSCDSDQLSRRRRLEIGGLDEPWQNDGKTSSAFDTKS